MWYIQQAIDVLPLAADLCVPLTLLSAFVVVVLFFKTKGCICRVTKPPENAF
jgi:hypothetical protein